MNIEETIKQFELDLNLRVNNEKYKVGIRYALGMLNKHLKYKQDCQFYGSISNLKCKECHYMCDKFQKKMD